MNDVSLRTIAAHGSTRAIKDIWRDDPFITRLRNFVDLTLPDLQSLRAVIETELTVKKRRDLVLDGYEFNKLCFVKGGFAARYKLLRNGKRQIVNFVLPGDVVGYRAVFSTVRLARSSPSPTWNCKSVRSMRSWPLLPASRNSVWH